MQLMSTRFGLLLFSAGVIAGCGSAQAPAADNGTAVYELVLMEKPDNVDEYAKLPLVYYDLCVTSAKINHVEVKPLPKLPPTLGATRTTYLFRGRDVVVRIEGLSVLDTTKMKPEQGCEVLVAADTRLNVDLQIGDMHTSITTTGDGHTQVFTEDNGLLIRAEASARAKSTAGYSESLTLNGIELRCLPKTDVLISSGVFKQACVYGRDGIIPQPHGRLLTLALRAQPLPNFHYDMITEPQSLRLIEHPDPKLFSAATYTR
jgi:hypothetical protein